MWLLHPHPRVTAVAKNTATTAPLALSRKRARDLQQKTVALSCNQREKIFRKASSIYCVEAAFEPWRAFTRVVVEVKTPDAWERYYTQCILGMARAGLGRFDEASALLSAGYEGMLQRQNTMPVEYRFALDRVAQWKAQVR